MENMNLIVLALALAIGSNVITFMLFQLIILAKWKGRRSPLGIVSGAIRTHYNLYLRIGRRKFKLEDLERRGLIQYVDWDLGLGYGFMEDPLRTGDLIYAKAPKKKRMVLIVYGVKTPADNIPNFFIFRTYFAGIKYEPKEEDFTVPESFQRKV